MTYVIAAPCVDVKDRSGVDEFSVDCNYEGGLSLFAPMLRGRSAPSGSPGGAAKLGPPNVDTELVREASAHGS